MKTREDFVTNSSSASFIMYIESTVDNIDDFKKDMQKFVNDYFNAFEWKFVLEDRKIQASYEKWMEEEKSEEIKQHYKDELDEFNNNKISREFVLRTTILATVSQISTNIFSVEDFTSMLNDLTEDLPHYMQHLIMLYITGEAIKYGIKSVKLKVMDYYH